MISALMLFAAATGQVIETRGDGALVRPSRAVAVGETLAVQRLEPAPGAPGRAPFFRWSKAAKVRVTALRSDGTAEVALVRGRLAAGDRVVVD
ncbi:hypothetical protein [Sphingomonas sp.]|jgi:hypothetical protein|uniref:hypothetical protein n=1 Tax=Sphingomonas sp. TaxID=28214 RepID=UPI002DE610CD|nr:hypothetical protein [Sphingomonas sp.]